jgi:hypothetical protein
MTRQADEAVPLEAARAAFEGLKQRKPESQAELDAWLASAEGKAATAFSDAEVYRWGDATRS